MVRGQALARLLSATADKLRISKYLACFLIHAGRQESFGGLQSVLTDLINLDCCILTPFARDHLSSVTQAMLGILWRLGKS
jgi:hypothetical protein